MRLYNDHEKIELKKQMKKQNLEREAEQKRIESKVLNSSRNIICNAFLRKFKNVLQKCYNHYDEIDDLTIFTYQEIEHVLKKIGFEYPEILNKNKQSETTDVLIKQLLKLLDPNHKKSINWGDLKRFFKKIAKNTINFNKNKNLYHIIQYLYVNKLLNDRTEKPQNNKDKPKLNKKDFLQRWNKEIEKDKLKC